MNTVWAHCLTQDYFLTTSEIKHSQPIRMGPLFPPPQWVLCQSYYIHKESLFVRPVSGCFEITSKFPVGLWTRQWTPNVFVNFPLVFSQILKSKSPCSLLESCRFQTVHYSKPLLSSRHKEGNTSQDHPVSRTACHLVFCQETFHRYDCNQVRSR